MGCPRGTIFLGCSGLKPGGSECEGGPRAISPQIGPVGVVIALTALPPDLSSWLGLIVKLASWLPSCLTTIKLLHWSIQVAYMRSLLVLALLLLIYFIGLLIPLSICPVPSCAVLPVIALPSVLLPSLCFFPQLWEPMQSPLG